MKTPLFTGYIEPKQSSIRYKFNYQGFNMLVRIKKDDEMDISVIPSSKEIDDLISTKLSDPAFKESVEMFVRNNFYNRFKK